MLKQLDFVAVGPHKTGTSWIYNYLNDYQQVALPTKVKETFFFDRKFDRGLDWYFSHFTQLNPGQKFGEIAPSYFSSTEATQRIYEHNPHCKILVTLREPVSRLVSFFMHMKQRGEVEPQTSFIEAIDRKEVLKDTALYYYHLSRWIETFGADNVRVMFFERLQSSPEVFAKELCQKLEIDLEDTSKDLSKKVNDSKAPVNHNLSRTLYSVVNSLHSLGLHKVVEYGKNLGIKQLITSSKTQEFQLSQDEFVYAFNLLEQDLMRLETLGLDLSGWKKVWSQQGITISNDFRENTN